MKRTILKIGSVLSAVLLTMLLTCCGGSFEPTLPWIHLPGITVKPVDGLLTTESGDKDSFTVVLDSKPTGDVTIEIQCNDTTEGTLSLLESTTIKISIKLKSSKT